MHGAVASGPRSYERTRWVSLALPIFIVEGFFMLLTNIDVIIVGHFMPPDQVAVYFAATKTLALVHMVYYAVRAGGAQRFSQYYASGERVRLAAFTRGILHWTFWPSLAMVLLLVVAGRWLLTLFGPSFGSGYALLLILSAGLLVRASTGPAESLLTMAGQQGSRRRSIQRPSCSMSRSTSPSSRASASSARPRRRPRRSPFSPSFSIGSPSRASASALPSSMPFAATRHMTEPV